MASLIKPPRLRPGDLIGVVAPASPMKPELLQRGVKYLEGLGYRVEIGRHVYQQHGYLAGTDRQRAQDLNRMFRDRRVRAVFCARGGYGTPRLLPLLDYDAIRRHPKIFVGYSDLTALQLAILRHARLITFSGPMVAAEMGRGIDPFTEEQFWRVLTAPVALGELTRPNGAAYTGITNGVCHGRLLGGCLSLIATVAGSRHMPSVSGNIFFVEEIGEVVYRLDRYFVQLRELGIFARMGAFLLGQTLDCDPPADEPSLTITDLLRDFVRPLRVPAMAGLDYGHGPLKYTLPLGVRAELEVSPRRKRLAVTEAAVA